MSITLLKIKLLNSYTLATACCLLWFSLPAQEDPKLEDRYFELYDKLEKHQYSNLDSASYYAERLLKLSTKNQDSLWIAAALEGQGYVHFYREEMDKALEKFTQQKDIFKKVAETVDLSLAYMNIANVQSGQAQYEQSIQNYLRAQRLLPEEPEYNIDRAYLNYNLANTLLDFEDFENAGKYLAIAEKMAKEEKLEDLYPSIANIQAELLLNKSKVREARALADSALGLSREKNDMIEEIYALELLARSELASGNDSKAILLQKESLRLARIYGDPYLEIMALVMFGEILLETGEASKALEYAEEAYSRRESQRSLFAQKEAARVYANVLKANNRPEDAFAALKQYTIYEDSLHHTNLNESILESQNEVFAKTNRLLEDKSALQNKIISRNRIIGIILIIGLALAAIAIFVIFTIINRKKKANRELQANEQLLDEKTKELGEANEKLEALNKGKDKLLSILTHDIKQPFNQTLGALEVLDLYSQENDELKTVLEEVKQSVENDKKTVENLLIWSKSQFARISANPTEIEWNKIADKVMSELKPSLEEKDIKLDLQANEKTRLIADPYHLEIILRNLITNAVKFSHKGGKLELSSQRLNGKVEIAVRDQGVGMSPQEISSLFDMNKHFSEKGTLNEAGTGLGMLIVFDFVKENNGEIQVESEPSKGSVFRLKFPAA